MTHLAYVGTSGTNVHTDIGHGRITLLHRALGTVDGAFVLLDNGRMAYAELGRTTGERDAWKEIDSVREITRDEFDDLTGLTQARHEMGWPRGGVVVTSPLPGDEDQYEEFKRLLDAPLPSTTKFEKLFSRPSVFSDDGASS